MIRFISFIKKWIGSRRQAIPIYGLLFILLTTNWVIPIDRHMQTLQWAQPETIPGISLDSYPPILVADQNKTVHAFSSQWVGNLDNPIRAIVYSQWTLDYGWSLPVDILISPVGEARITSAYLDKNDVIHLIFFGGNGISGDIYYTKAAAASASDATAWSTPVIAGEKAGDPESAALVGDDQGRLTIVYHGKRDGNGVYAVNSNDGGETWSYPSLIFLSKNNAPYVFGIRAIIGESGWLHVIWNTFSEEGQGRGIYYARSKFGNLLWDDPIPLVNAKSGLGSQTPTIIEYQSILYAVYNLTPKISMRRSRDNGLTWDDPTALFSRHVGVNGSLSLVVDGNDQMHLFFGQRISGTQGNADVHGMWHSVWVDGRWSEPDAVIKGPRITDMIGTEGFDPFEAHAIVSQGNVLLVTWRTDPGIFGNGVWFSYTVVDAPEAPVATLQSPLIQKKNTSTVTAITSAVVVSPTPQINFDRGRPGGNRFVWVIVGLAVFGFLWILNALFTRH